MVLGWWRQKFWWSIQLTDFRFRFKIFISDPLLFFNLQALVHCGPVSLEKMGDGYLKDHDKH